MTLRSRAVAFFGLTGGPSSRAPGGERIPQSDGNEPGAAWRYVSMWLLVSLVTFHLLNSRMPQDDGFGGFVPVYGAMLVGWLGVTISERGTLRRPNSTLPPG